MNYKTKHTPGPWRLRTHPSLPSFVEGPQDADMPYALDVCGDDYTGYGDAEQRENNMRLIAAAPELLEAAIWIVKYADSEPDGGEYVGMHRANVERARRAIEKAIAT